MATQNSALGEGTTMNNFIDARGFTFEPFAHPFHEDGHGDSGTLEIATSKTNPDEQYIIKNKFPELGCNELMYHRVAKALGLYTQEAKLISGNKAYRRAAAIRYVPNARLFDLAIGSRENFRTFFEFEALFVILNEDDSHEYYLDEQDRLFKLDNAASFTVSENTINWFAGDAASHFFIPDIDAPLNAVGYSYYSITLQSYKEKHGQAAADAYLSLIERFADFDKSVLADVYAALDKQYSRMLKMYYSRCIDIRKETCRRFLKEVGRC